MSKYNKGYEFSFYLDNRRMTEMVYAENVLRAQALVEARYGSKIKSIQHTGNTMPSQDELDKKRERENNQHQQEQKQQRYEQNKQQQELKNQQKKQMRIQEQKLKELEDKTANIDYQQKAQNLKSEIENISPNIQEWEQVKSTLEEEINSIILEVREKINEFSKYSSSLQDTINTINTKIDKHNNQPNIYNSNKINLLKNLDDTLNTEVDFTKKTDEDLGIGGWIFVILILVLILYGADWFFELNIYSSAYEFIKNLFGHKA